MSLEIMERIIERATAKEMDFLIFSMRYQDDMGIVRGITKSEICDALKINKSKFYDMLKRLEEKGIIHVFWHEKRHGFWSFCVIDNTFTDNESYKKGYINLNTYFLSTEEFLKLTKAEKTICLKILSLYRETRNSIPLKLSTIMSWTGSSLKATKKHVNSIMSIFQGIKIQANIITLDIKLCFYAFTRTVKSEREIRDQHLLDYILAAKKIKDTQPNEIKDTLTIFKTLSKHGTNTIITAIIRCIDTHGTLIPKYINKLTQVISKDKNKVKLFY